MNNRRSRALVATCMWVVVATMLAAAPPTLAANSAGVQGVGQASFAGVTFNYDKSLATNVAGRNVPSNIGQDGSVYEIRPEHISFSFEGYPSKGVWTPGIRVIPLDAYKSAQARSDIGGALSSLEGYIGSDLSAALPLLPPVSDRRIISEGVAPVVGRGVTGVRFVASYSQGPVPVAEENITYMFIGLTADRKYYVEGTFPLALSTRLDPPPATITPQSAEEYNQAVAARLRQTGASGFAPNLDNLDKMMGSIQVGAAVIPGMPITGRPQTEGLLFAVLALAATVVAAGLAITTGVRARH